MLILVVYDISNNKVRFDLANYLKTKGFVRIQRSVFIGKPLPSILRDVERCLGKFVKSNSDVIHLVPVYEVSVNQIKVYGSPLADLPTIKKLLVIS